MAPDEQLVVSPPAASPLLVVRVGAVLLGVAAAGCWLAATAYGLQLRVGEGAAGVMHWWSGLPVGAGVAVAVLVWFVAGRGGRRSVLGVLAVLLVLGVGVIVFTVAVVPEPSPIRPLSLGVLFGYAGFVAAGSACLLSLVSIMFLAQPAGDAERPRGQRVRATRLVALTVTAGLIVAAGWVLADRSQEYLLGINEYRSGQGVDRPAAPPPASTLAGGDRWRIGVPGVTLAQPAVTAYGIALVSGQNVVMVDAASGRERWRYTRSDVAGQATLAATDNGRRLLVWWGTNAVYLLDARTGERVGHWPESRWPVNILDPALPVITRTDSDGETTIDRVTPSGSRLWSYPLGACSNARARLADDTVVVEVSVSCGTSVAKTVGLDSATGQQRWSTPVVGEVRGAVPGSVIMLSTPTAGARTLSAVDLRDGSIRWSRPLPLLGGSAGPCTDVQTATGASAVVVVCSWDLTDYPLGPEHFVSTVDIYAAGNGTPRRAATYRTGPVVAAAVAHDGRVVVARVDPGGWLVETADLRPKLVATTPDPYPDHLAVVRTLSVVGNQVFVIDSATEVLRCLR